MPAWDDPAYKWDDSTVGWAGGAVSSAVPITWDDANNNWSANDSGWSGERTDLGFYAPTGLYVRNPALVMSGLQASMVTFGMPGQPSPGASNYMALAMKVIVPPGQEATQIDYDLYPNTYPSLGVRMNRGWFSVNADDGQTWAGTPSWWGSTSIYKRSGNTVYRIVAASVAAGWWPTAYSARCRLPDREWIDVAWHPGLASTPGQALPDPGWQVHPTMLAGHGPRARRNDGVTRDANALVWRERSLGNAPVYLWRRAGYPAVTANSGGATTLNSFTVTASPLTAGMKIAARCMWRTGANWLLTEHLLVADLNPFVNVVNGTVIANADSIWVGHKANEIGGWANGWPLTVGQTTVTCEAYSIQGVGSRDDPYRYSAQGFAQFNA